MTKRDPQSDPGPAEDARPDDPKVRAPKPRHRPAPHVKHVPEPDAENIMPAEHEPGTL